LTPESAAGEFYALARSCAGLAAGGVELVLVREKRLEAGALAQLSRSVMEAVRATGTSTRVLIAQRLDVAIAAGADGVHLSARAGELTVSQVKQLMPQAFVTVSCHSTAEVERARDAGASAVLFGPVFGKTVDGVEVVAGVGLERLREACEGARKMPVFALGGVTEANAQQCVDAGAAGIAGIRMFFRGRQMN
jgi:thiamine-phosphate pyrophosphorylase